MLSRPDNWEQELIKFYLVPNSAKSTCTQFKCSYKTLRKILKKYDIAEHNPELVAKIKANAIKQTCMKKYGVDNPAKVTCIQEKIKATNNLKYGGNAPACNKEIIQKMKNTCLEKFGVDSYSSTIDFKTHYSEINNSVQEKRILTNLNKYGVKQASQSDEVKQKMKSTCIEKYNVEWFNQSDIAHHNFKKVYYVNNIIFDSFPELCFYLYHKQRSLNIVRPTISFQYSYNNQIHYYFPDFKLNDEFYELKGPHFVKEDGTWQNPFDHTLDAIMEAKRQCALQNNVKILYKKDYQKYIDWFYENNYKKEDYIIKEVINEQI